MIKVWEKPFVSIQETIRGFWVGEWDDKSIAALTALPPYEQINVDAERVMQFYIDLVYRLYVSNLIEFWPKNYFDKHFIGLTGIDDFCDVLAHTNPFYYGDGNMDTDYATLWIGTLLYLSPKGEQLLEKYNYLAFEENVVEANIDFMQEVLNEFEKHDVPYTDNYIFPRYCLTKEIFKERQDQVAKVMQQNGNLNLC